jgi:two-component SAPR family response regulator
MQNFYKKLFSKLWVYGFVLCLSALFVSINAQGQGLMFNANETLLNQRTSYDVFNYTTPTFDNHLIISFDLSLWDNENLGYIFSLTGKHDSYSLSYLYFHDKAVLNFNIDRKSNKLNIPLEQSQMGKRKWIKIKVDLDLVANTACVWVDNKCYKAGNIDFEDSITPKLIFGLNPYYKEVPDMAIKNLLVSDGASQSYFFPLNEWAGNVAHDQSGEEIGLIQNPVWLSNESYFWKPVFNHTFANVEGLNFAPAEDELVMYGHDSLTVFHPGNNGINTLAYKNPMPIPMVLGKSIFNTKEDKVYAYEAYNETKGAVNMASLDMKTMEWQSIGKTSFPQQRHHHNIFYNAAQDSIYLFGGYGSFHYYDTIYNYNPKQDKWLKVKFKGDTITPRFFSAVGKAEGSDDVYLFGGYGNESGSQIVGGKQYYDLYRINLKEHTIKKLWEIHPSKDVFVPANNLVLSGDGKYFYAMCYPHETFKTYIKLYKFAIADGAYQVMSAPIPVTSERIESDINLFLDAKTNQMLCTIQEFTDNRKSTVKVYSLAYPPVANMAYLSSASHLNKASLKGILIGIVVAGFLVAGAGAWLYKPKRKPLPVMEDISEAELELSLQSIGIQKVDEPKANSIKLLGEFEAYNRKGKDITYLFSPKIKQLFMLIMMNSIDGNGIGSKKISQVLWPDKDVAKTKNIKGVTFNHLRNIISDMDGIELNFVNDIYIFSLDEQFFCDYCVVIGSLKKDEDSARELIVDNFDLINRGSLLTDMADPWLDDFKQHYEEQLMQHLLPQLRKFYTEENYKVVLELSRLLNIVDPFNDSVLKYQLKSDRRLKGIDHSKKIYDHYVQEYKKSLGVDYQVSFDKLLS